MITPAELKTKTVCFRDNGLFTAFARKLAPAFKKAYYAPVWKSQFPKSNQVRLGEGYPEMEQVKYPLLLADEVDLWVYLDCYHADETEFLRSHGARVWGAGVGEELENDRWEFNGILHQAGLPVPEVELVKGLDELRKALKGRKNLWIKLRYGQPRGDRETWKWKNDTLGAHVLDEIAFDLGVFQQDTEFIIEAEIEPAVEIGFDGMTVLGEYPDPAVQAYEVKGIGMIGVVKPYGELAEPVRLVNAKMAPWLKEKEVRSFMSTEIRYTPSRKAFYRDPCMRLGSPSNELLQEMLAGWPVTLWEGAEGRLVSPTAAPGAKYGVVLMVYSEQSGKVSQPLYYPAALDNEVKLRNGVRVGGRNVSLAQGSPSNIASITGVGPTLDAAIKAAEANAAKVDGHLIEIGTDAIAKAEQTIEEGKKYGIKF